MRFIETSLLAASALALGLGCAPSNPGLVAEGVLTFDAMCTVAPNNNLLIEGTLDIGTTYSSVRPNGISYALAVRVGNQLINTGNRVYPLMADPNRIIIHNVEITLLDTSENVLALPGAPNPYLVPSDGAVASTQSMDPTLGIAAATVIPDAYGQLIAGLFPSGGTILVRARVIGTTVGDATLTSNPVVFPISLCVDCLFQPSCDSMMRPVYTPSCLPGQDAISLVPPRSMSCP